MNQMRHRYLAGIGIGLVAGLTGAQQPARAQLESLIAQGQPAAEIQRTVLLPPSRGNPRNSEGDFIRLKSGELMFVYSHFVGGINDQSRAYLAARFSGDDGRTWTSKDTPVVSWGDAVNVMSASLLRLPNGDIGLFYLRKRSMKDARPVMRTSRDEGRTWSDPTEIITDHVGYYVLNNSRVIRLKSGRILVPVAVHGGKDGEFQKHGRVTCYLSDDGGHRWRRSSTVLDVPEKSKDPNGLQEPGVVQLKDGRVMLFARTDLGSQYVSYSSNDGKTWSPARASNIRSPLAPATIKRIPSTGDLLLIWNPTYNPKYVSYFGPRSPLNIAVSRDDGATWIHEKMLETDPKHWFDYAAATFFDDRIILAYGGGSSASGGLDTIQMTTLPISYLYQ